jgi:hypothetical protein
MINDLARGYFEQKTFMPDILPLRPLRMRLYAYRANALCIKSKLIRQKSNYESKKTAWETSFPQFVSGNPALLLLDAR